MMMKQRKKPFRTCVVTKEVLDKKELIRIVRTPEKEVIIDLSGKANGRGAYLKKDKAVVLEAKKTKILDRKLEVNVSEEIYLQLLDIIENE